RWPGVLAVLTGEDYVGDGHIGMAHFPNPADANDVSIPTFAPTPERKILDQLQPPLALGCVRFVGEAVAVVVAESPVAARDAAEAVVVEYQVLPAVTDVMEALAGGAPAIWPDVVGAFGSRFNIYPEQVAVVWAARRVVRPVKWTADRSEAFLTDYTARDVVTRARLAFDRRGRMLALALELTANTGAHTVSYV